MYVGARLTSYFNPRPREEGDTLGVARVPTPVYFNPRPREEGDFHPLREAAGREMISIHALVKRATHTANHAQSRGWHFNPRPREEGDLGYLVTCEMQNDFNPRPREEGDVLRDFTRVILYLFQSTPS